MGACETTPTTTRDPGETSPATFAPDNQQEPTSSPPNPATGDQVTGSIQHCLLTTESPMGAISRCLLHVAVALVTGAFLGVLGAEGLGDALVGGGCRRSCNFRALRASASDVRQPAAPSPRNILSAANRRS